MIDVKKHLKNIKNTRFNISALNKLTLKSKLQGMLLLTSLGSLLVIGTTSWLQARNTLEAKIADQLIGVRTAKADKFELFFENLYNQVGTLADDGRIVEAMVGFNRGFRQLERRFPESELDPVLEAYYTKEFFPRLSKNLLGNNELKYETYRPSAQAGRYLQYNYLAKNPNSVGEKDKLLDTGDGSYYNQIHKKHQTYFRKLIEKFGYYDLFLINHRTRDMVYSVYKETDYGTNLLTGPYSRSGLAEVVREVINNPQAGSIQVVDFKPYRPSYEAPAAFVAAPIFSGFNLIGILAVQVPIDKINRVMSQDNDWEAAGLGKTGEAYLIGSDLSMRSQSRFLQEQPKRYKTLARRNGTPKKSIELIEKLNTTIGLQKVENRASQLALGGEKGIKVVKDYRGVDTLTAYGPLELSGLDWAIITQIDLGEAYQPLYSLQIKLLIAGVVFILLTAVGAEIAANIFIKPFERLKIHAQKVANGENDAQLEVISKDEFGEMTKILNAIALKLNETNQQLEAKSQENDNLLHNLLPSSIVKRMKAGETLIADQIKQVTIVYAQIGGIGDLSREKSAEEVTQLLTKLVEEFDKAGLRYGMERQTSGSTDYMAFCGLTQPRLDHTKRATDFAIAMVQSLNRLQNLHQSTLALRIGIHSGSVNAGVVGKKKFAFNIWGENVYLATRIYARAQPNHVVMTEEAFQRVADAYTFMPNPIAEIENIGQVKTWTLVTSNKMTVSEVDLVQSSFAKVAPIADKVGELFYKRLFELDPSLRPLFKGDMQVQQRKLMATLGIVVEGLRHPENIIEAAQELGRKHAEYGVIDEHYKTVGEALLWTLQQGLGKDFTPEVRSGWVTAFTLVSGIMRDAAAEIKLQSIGV